MKNQKIENNKGEIVNTFYKLYPLNQFEDFIVADLYADNIKRSKVFFPIDIWNNEFELQNFIDQYNFDRIKKNNSI